jgi:2-polyprenyl-3-methyl-5-hydroxy-6-metoxy-1,4-benzoquinol methylase
MTLPTTSKACYVCGAVDNPIVAREPAERRFGKPVIPEGIYEFARCRECSTLYVNSSVTDEYLADIYANETVETVKEIPGADHEAIVDVRLPEFRSHWADLKRLCPPRPGDALLDIGCQTGDFGTFPLADGVVPNGIEMSRSYADVCRQRWGGGSLVHCGPVAQAPFAPRQFRYITSFETLEHTCEPIAVLEKARQWLAPDGRIALSVPSSDYFHFKFWLLRRSLAAGTMSAVFRRRSEFYATQVLPHTHIYNFSMDSVGRLLARSGFVPVHMGLTGWHGSSAPLFGAVGSLLAGVSGSRIAFAPSVFAIARLRD